MKGKHGNAKNEKLREELAAARHEVSMLRNENQDLHQDLGNALEAMREWAKDGDPRFVELSARYDNAERRFYDEVEKQKQLHRAELDRVYEWIDRLAKVCESRNVPMFSRDDMRMLSDIFGKLPIARGNREQRRNIERNAHGPDAMRRALNYQERNT